MDSSRVISHPNLSLLIAGHEDKYLRFFDPNTSTENSNEEAFVLIIFYSR